VKVLIRIGFVLAALGVMGFLFIRSLEDTRSEPYPVGAADVDSWTLVESPGMGAKSPILSLRTRPELVSNLSRHVFRRVMESLASPAEATIPLVLQGEFEAGLARTMTPATLMAAARAAGLESAPHVLRCLAHRRESEGRNVRQVYFVIVDSPSIRAFREQLAQGAGSGFEAAALTPVVVVAHAESSFERWLPIQATQENCVAPIRVER
jgi:hypothetical protein